VAYRTYSGGWLTQSDAQYQWLANQWQPIVPMSGVDTVKIWQSLTLPQNSPINNLIVFGDGNYAAGNDKNNVLVATNARDLIYGARGEDVFIGSGGSGTTFVVAEGEGAKAIENFSGADKLRLIGGSLTSFNAVTSAMTQQGSDVFLNAGGTMVAFRNASIGQFQPTNFELPLNYAALGAPVFRDEFDNPATLGAQWDMDFGYAGDGRNSFTLPGNAELEIYTSASFKGTAGAPLGLNPHLFNNGVLTLRAEPVNAYQSSQMWGYSYSSGMIQSDHVQTYGYFEMRAELPKGQGLWPAFWLIGPQNREIDILEGLGSDTKVVHNAVHSPVVPALGNASFNPYADGFHTYGVMWGPQTITYYVDGSPVWNTPTPSDMDQPMRMIVNLAVGGNWPGPPDGSTPWPADMKIDYVRTYALPSADGGTTPTPPPPASGGGAATSPPPATSGGPGGQVLFSAFPGASLTGGAAGDQLHASQGADRLTGGAGADTFVFKAMPWSAGHVTDFQVGVDKLDIAALWKGYSGSDPVGDGYLSLVGDGSGGTRVLVDTDGWAGGNTIKFVVTTLDGVAPTGLAAATLLGVAPPSAPSGPSGSAGGLSLTAPHPGATLKGGTGADTLNASQGADILTGAAGADQFVFGKPPWSAGRVTDFTPGVDMLDLRPMLASVGYHGSNPVADGYIKLAGDGIGGARVMFDEDGWSSGRPWMITVTTLENVSPSGLGTTGWLVA